MNHRTLLPLFAAALWACSGGDTGQTPDADLADTGVDASDASDTSDTDEAADTVDDTSAPDAGDPCDPNPCLDANRGVCSASGAQAICSCDAGYHDLEGTCVEDAGPCDANPCTAPNRGICTEHDGAAICSCDAGYHDADGVCVEDMGACDAAPCTEPNRGVCEDRDGVAVCSCDAGYVDVGGACELDQVCTADTCQAPHRSVCVDLGGLAECRCDAGYVDVDGVCTDADLCDPNPCTEDHRGVCAEGPSATVVCSCDEGYADRGDGCVLADPCAADPCTAPHQGVCADGGGVAICSCDPGYVESDTGCVLEDPCGDLDCEAHAHCELVEDAPLCLCDAGYEDTDGACVEIPPPTCDGSHTDGDSYEPDECPSLATPIARDTPQLHSIDPMGDVDWVTFSAGAHEILAFSESTATDMYFNLYDTDGATTLRSTDNESFYWEFQEAGEYYLRARHYYSNRTGDYELTVSSLGFDDYPDTLDEAVAIGVDEVISGRVESRGDLEAFTFPVEANHVYRISEDTTFDEYWSVYDVDGTLLRSSDSSAIRVIFAEAGEASLILRHYSSTSIGDWSFTITDLGEEDYPGSLDEATPIGIGEAVSGEIEVRGDTDAFTFPVLPHVYAFEETTATDVYWNLYDGDGGLLRATDNESFRWEFDAAGNASVVLRHYSSTSIGAWAFTITDLGPDDYGDTQETATLIASETDYVGELETRGDVDAFALEVEAGHIYSFAESTGTDVYWTLLDAEGRALRTTDLESFRWEFNDAGTVTALMRHYSSTSIGSWAIRVTDMGLDDHGDTPAEASSMSLDARIEGEIETRGDRDVFAVTVTAGQVVWVAESTGLDVAWTVYDRDGATVLHSTEYESFGWEFATAGTYTISVRASSSTAIGAYTVDLVDGGLDAHGDTAPEATSVSAGVTTDGRVDYPYDEDWYAFTPTVGSVYRVAVTSPSTVRVRVYADPSGSPIATTTSSTTPTLEQGTTYYLRVDANGSATSGINYTLTVTD